MRKISIIGAGQAGLQLAIGLLKKPEAQNNYIVTLYNNKTAAEIREGNILSSQGMFHTALTFERNLKVDFWQQQAPQNHHISFSISKSPIQWIGKTTHPYQSVDQRLKFSAWMEEFEKLGGHLVIQDIDLKTLDNIAKKSDLTIVASGKGEIGKIFQTDFSRSVFKTPQRVLACLYLRHTIPARFSGVKAYIIPEIGEFFIMPGLSLNGSCEMLLFEGIPKGPFDCWNPQHTINERVEIALKLLKKYLPLEAERCQYAAPTDAKASLVGSYTPHVKYPTAKLPCGKFALGIGDVVVLNDPIAGQGANTACKAANLYLEKIIEHQDKKFDATWMKQVFESHWESDANYATQWSNTLLMQPKPFVLQLLEAAGKFRKIANMLANGFNEPSVLFPWINSAESIYKFIEFEKNLSLRNRIHSELLISSIKLYSHIGQKYAHRHAA